MQLQLVHSGKVRDVYKWDDDCLLMVASDRMSAFDVVMNEPVPDKGRILTGMTEFWFDYLADIAPNHLAGIDVESIGDLPDEFKGGRSMIVRKAEMLPIECIVRGYLAGSALKEYNSVGTVHGVAMPTGLQIASALPQPIFTPSTKADAGSHDENISYEVAIELVGTDVAEAARDLSLAAYEKARKHAESNGLIIADTKFELGYIDGKLSICDEVLTPDSSRFWPADDCEPGTTPPSFDKQPLRDWLEEIGWNKQPPAPTLPQSVIDATHQRYVIAFELLVGSSLS